MKCKCGTFIHVKSSYIRTDGNISRKRVCSNCGNIIYTVEVPRTEFNALKRLSQDLRWSVDRYISGRKIL